MTQKLEYSGLPGAHVAHDKVSSAAASTVYSDKFSVHVADVWNAQFEWEDDAADYEAEVTLWASDKPVPDEADDTDWVQMVSGHGFDGLPGGDPAGGNGKDMTDVSASGALWYRWKIARSAGSATWQIYVVRKDRR